MGADRCPCPSQPAPSQLLSVPWSTIFFQNILYEPLEVPRQEGVSGRRGCST